MSSSNLDMPQWREDWSDDQFDMSGPAPAQIDPGFSGTPAQTGGIIGGLLDPAPYGALPDSANIGRGVEGVLRAAPDPTYFPM